MTAKSYIFFGIGIFATFGLTAATYDEYALRVMNTSKDIISKRLLLDSAIESNLAVDYYYLPRVTVDSMPRKDVTGRMYTDTGISVNSLLYDTSLSNRIREGEATIGAARLVVDISREDILKTIYANAFSINEYESLKSHANSLLSEARDLSARISTRQSIGVIKSSDVQLAQLLIQKLERDIIFVDNEIVSFKRNIEAESQIPYPSDGIQIMDKVNKVSQLSDECSSVDNNLELMSMGLKMVQEKEKAAQSDSLAKVNLILNSKYEDLDPNKKDSYVGVNVSVNIFDIGKKSSSASMMKNYESLSMKRDVYYEQLNIQMARLKQERLSSFNELNNLEQQKATIIKLIKNQANEYNVANSSLYEMLNVRYDLFSLEKRISDTRIALTQNNSEHLKLCGKILNIIN